MGNANETPAADAAEASVNHRSRVAPTAAGGDEVYVVGAGSVLANGCYKRVFLTTSAKKARQGGGVVRGAAAVWAVAPGRAKWRRCVHERARFPNDTRDY